ncbi:hypothetical protein Y032_0124g1194 [Ancylostoma ceylanicum]|uniref:CCHC-type domain-containing protein n=1 Tax=Ancylostoma ceylanicum TaxID=53326 RepID=A0A016T8X9_9BILA|nr:hypothetical protein Y032_0124g1194 [Ancylostoma ceylanicum]
MEICVEYPESRAQKAHAPIKYESEILRGVPLSSFSQTNASQNRGGSIALLKKEIAAKANVANRSGQQSIGEVTESRARHTSHRPNYIRRCIFCQKGNHLSTRCRTVSDQSMRRRALREQNRCWKCFSPNHNSFVCHKQDCSTCGQKHHNSLCFKKRHYRLITVKSESQ